MYHNFFFKKDLTLSKKVSTFVILLEIRAYLLETEEIPKIKNDEKH